MSGGDTSTMKQTYVIEYSDFEELKEKATALAMSLGALRAVNPSEKVNITPASEPVVEHVAEPVAEPKKAQKKKAEKVEAPAPVSSAITEDAATASLKKVSEVKGLTVAREILTSVGASRMSEVKPDTYAQFIELCEKALA